MVKVRVVDWWSWGINFRFFYFIFYGFDRVSIVCYFVVRILSDFFFIFESCFRILFFFGFLVRV